MVYDKIEMTVFSLQEFTIAGLYVYETRKLLKPGAMFQKKRARRVMGHLIYINILIIFLDITLLATEYANLFEIEGIYKATVYSIKLLLEFSILNQLMEVAQGGASVSGTNPESLRSGTKTREIAPGALGSRNRYSNAHTLESGFSISSARRKSAPNDCKVDGVMKTTEISIHSTHHSSSEDKSSTEFLENANNIQQAPPNAKQAELSSSSEEEFAKMGY